MIPDEAVEAAAKAHFERNGGRWEDWTREEKAVELEDMRAALEAAAPHLMAEAFAYGWREGKGWPTPVDVTTGELLHDEAKQPDWNPYKQEVEK